jgi:hypothetical protein
MTHHDPTPAGRRSRQRRGAWRWLLLVPALLVLLVLGIVLFVPVEALRGPVERQFSRATGYQVTIGKLNLSLVGMGLGLGAGDFAAISRDGSQAIRVPELKLGVRLIPLLSKRVEITRVDAPELELRMGAPGSQGRAATGEPERSTGEGSSTLEAPDIRVSGGRLIHTGANGTTRLGGVSLAGGFKAGGAGALFSGTFEADSVSFAPAASPDAPLTLPKLAAKFESNIDTKAQAAATTLDGKVGTIPAKGTIDTKSTGGRWVNTGRIALETIGLDDVKPLFSGPPARMVAQYDLGGRFERGEITFQTFADREEMDFRVVGHLAGVVASLPGKGRVIDAGDADLTLVPDRGTMIGNFRSGQATLGLDAELTRFADPHWTARIDLAGPLAEALRFLPPQPELEVHSGSVTANLTAAGRFGPTTVPDVNGTVALREAALRHSSIAVPVDRFDCHITLDGRTVTLRDGAARAGRSDARFTGRIEDYTKPKLTADIHAGTIDLAELFPSTGGTATTAPPGGKDAASRPPVTGHITIDRMVRKEVTLTDVASAFTIDGDGMTLTDLTGRAWGGTVKGNLSLLPKGEQTLEYSGDLDIQGVHAEELLATYTPVKGLQGLLTTDLKLSGRNAPGLNPLSVLTLIGKGFVLEGRFVNLPVIRRISEAIGFTPGMGETIPFKTIRHSIHVQNGFADLDSFTIRQDAAEWKVGGRIGLDGRLDCPVTARIAVNQFQPGSRLAEFAALLADKDGRLPIGFHLGGTLTSPDVKLNLEPLLAAAQKKAAQTAQDEIRKRLEDLIRGKLGGPQPPGPPPPGGGSGTATGSGTGTGTGTTAPPGPAPRDTSVTTPGPTPPKGSVEDELRKRLDDLFKKKPPPPKPPAGTGSGSGTGTGTGIGTGTGTAAPDSTPAAPPPPDTTGARADSSGQAP